MLGLLHIIWCSSPFAQSSVCGKAACAAEAQIAIISTKILLNNQHSC